MNIKNIIKLFFKIGPKEWFFEVLYKISRYKRYDYPLQWIRKPFDMWFMHLARNKYLNFNEQKQLFSFISVQTCGYCNYNCPFCPNNKAPRPQGFMTMKLFKKIIKELKELDFDGIIALYMMGEPLMDKRIVEFSKIASTSCPKSIIHIETNGSLLTEKLFHQLMIIPNLLMRVNDYSSNSWVFKKIDKFKISNEENKRLTLQNRRINITMTNRAGNMPESKFKLPLPYFCNRPFTTLSITDSGKCVICCSDWQVESVIGDANKSKLVDIWRGKPVKTVREKLLNKDRRIGICQKCDFLGYQSDYKETIRRIKLLNEDINDII